MHSSQEPLALCEKHGVPYIQENVFKRTKKTIDIMVGTSSMRWFPEEYEKKFLDKDAVVEGFSCTKVEQ